MLQGVCIAVLFVISLFESPSLFSVEVRYQILSVNILDRLSIASGSIVCHSFRLSLLFNSEIRYSASRLYSHSLLLLVLSYVITWSYANSELYIIKCFICSFHDSGKWKRRQNEIFIWHKSLDYSFSTTIIEQVSTYSISKSPSL